MNSIGQFIRANLNRQFFNHLQSQPVGQDGQNRITAVTPMKFLPIKEFESRQKSIYANTKLALDLSSMNKVKNEAIEKKKRAKECFQTDDEV